MKASEADKAATQIVLVFCAAVALPLIGVGMGWAEGAKIAPNHLANGHRAFNWKSFWVMQGAFDAIGLAVLFVALVAWGVSLGIRAANAIDDVDGRRHDKDLTPGKP